MLPYNLLGGIQIGFTVISGLRKNVGVAMALSSEKGVLYVLRLAIGGYLLLARLWVQEKLRLAVGRFLRIPLVHVIGDSHSWSLRDCPGTIIHNIGPATAYNLANENSAGQYGRKLFDVVRCINRGKDTVLLVFGEIDCRVHIYNHFMKSGGSVTINELLDRTIDNYGKIMEQLKREGTRFCVYGIIPATRHVLRYPPFATARMRRQMNEDFRSRYPYQASPETRSKINHEFNAKLKKHCLKCGYHYFDIYARTVDEHGFIKDEYRKDEIHVNRRAGKLVSPWLANQRADGGRPGKLIS